MPIHFAGSVDLAETAVTGKDLRTGVWHGDATFTLRFPVDWQLTILWPATPPPLCDAEIEERLRHPVGQAPVWQLAQGKSRPLVIVDDTMRPTPVGRVLPHLLKQFQMAGIPPHAVKILVATGAHGSPRTDALIRKLGPAAAECEVVVHSPHEHLIDLGKTSRGTQICANREIQRSDFLIGIGGIYPDETAGFGGGSKLALGVLGLETIRELYSKHPRAGWGRSPKNEFRQHLDEIASKIGLRSVISIQIDVDRDIFRLACGDPLIYYPEELAAAQRVFTAPPPDDADVVISNAYPGDLSLTSVERRGLAPLRKCPPEASRVVLAACAEGVGVHEVFPVQSQPFWKNVLARLNLVWRRHRHPIWLFQPNNTFDDLPPSAGEIQPAASWQQVLDAVRREQAGKTYLRVYLYPCAPLQCFTRS